MSRIIAITEFIYKFIALNFLWLLFLLLGLGIFGFMPATVALFSIIRQWIKGEKNIPLFKTYFKFYKAEFIRSNIIGIIFLLIFYLIYVNFSFVSFFYPENIQIFIYMLILFVGLIVLMTFINLFPVMAHFEYKTLQYIKVAAGLVFLQPLRTLLQITWVIAYVLIAINFPKIFIVIGVSVFSYVLMNINYSIFQKYKVV